MSAISHGWRFPRPERRFANQNENPDWSDASAMAKPPPLISKTPQLVWRCTIFQLSIGCKKLIKVRLQKELTLYEFVFSEYNPGMIKSMIPMSIAGTPSLIKPGSGNHSIQPGIKPGSLKIHAIASTKNEMLTIPSSSLKPDNKSISDKIAIQDSFWSNGLFEWCHWRHVTS